MHVMVCSENITERVTKSALMRSDCYRIMSLLDDSRIVAL